MTDRKPPRVSGDERATLVALLQYLRESVVRKVEGVADQDARWSPVPTGTSLLWIVKHLARAEALWFLDASPDSRSSLSSSIRRRSQRHPGGGHRPLSATWVRVDDVVAASDLDAICVGVDEEANPICGGYFAHLVEETARHAGHADILRELIDGQTGR